MKRAFQTKNANQFVSSLYAKQSHTDFVYIVKTINQLPFPTDEIRNSVSALRKQKCTQSKMIQWLKWTDQPSSICNKFTSTNNSLTLKRGEKKMDCKSSKQMKTFRFYWNMCYALNVEIVFYWLTNFCNIHADQRQSTQTTVKAKITSEFSLKKRIYCCRKTNIEKVSRLFLLKLFIRIFLMPSNLLYTSFEANIFHGNFHIFLSNSIYLNASKQFTSAHFFFFFCCVALEIENASAFGIASNMMSNYFTK